MCAHTCPRTGICTDGAGNENSVGYTYLKQARAKLEIFVLKSVGSLQFKQSVNLYKLE